MANSSERSFEDCYCLTDLPSEVLVTILEYLPLLDLSNVRLVCSRLQKIADNDYLWARTSLNSTWVSAENLRIFQRAADCGNVEALTVLAVAYLYTQGVPEGSGKGTLGAVNGLKATEYLRRAERLTPHSQPFSWVLFRPPWTPNHLCYKACVCNQMKQVCNEASTKAESLGLHCCVGKILAFQELEDQDGQMKSREWFERGADHRCPYSALEAWRSKQKPRLYQDSFQCVRQLRKIATQLTDEYTCIEAQFELCEAYAWGYYGGTSQELAFHYIREVMASSKPVLWTRIFKLQDTMTHDMRYILIDWLVEVAETKEFPPPTVHMAINLIDRYLLRRRIPTSKLQLLGITALVLGSRWMNETMITIREASWLTDHTYTYDEVVKMMGELVAVFKGDLRKSTVCDYLQILLKLAGANETTKFMAYYLSEMVLLHTKFGRFSAAHLAAACLLEARILLGQEYPWPLHMSEATGFTVRDLRKCCLNIYDRCLTDKYVVEDHRKVKMESVSNRFSEKRFNSVGKYEFMSCKELQEHLGMEPESPCPLLTPPTKLNQKKVLSFLSDSCYLSPTSPLPSRLVGGDSGNGSSPESLKSLGLEESLVEQFSTQRLSSSSSSSSGSSSPNQCESNFHLDRIKEEPLLQPSFAIGLFPPNDSLRPGSSDFPQPTFSDCSSTISSPPDSPTSASPWEEQMDVSEHPTRDEPSWSDSARQDSPLLDQPPLSDSARQDSPLLNPSWSGSSLAAEEFDFNLEPLNELPSLEPCESMLLTGVITNSPRRNPIPTSALECETQAGSSRRENSQHKKLVPHDQYPNRREVLRPLQNFHFLPLPVSPKETERQRSTKGLSGKLKRRKKGNAN